MSFSTRRFGEPAALGLRSVPDRPADNAPLIACCRHLAHQLVPEPVGALTRLQRDLVAVGQEFDRVLADPGSASVIRSGVRPWPEVTPHLLELLLVAAGHALAGDPSLTALIADTVLRAQRSNRAAWRLRAQAHERWGDLTAAIAAHQEYLDRTETGHADTVDVVAAVVTLREQRDARVALASALLDAHDVGDVLPMPGAADLHDLLSRPCRRERLDPALEDFLADLTRLPVVELASVCDVLHTVVHCLRTSQLRPAPLPSSTVRSLEVLRLGDLRGWLAGRSICLVAEPDRLAASGGASAPLGKRIDAYDLVARFASGPLDPANTGTRTDLMVIRHDQRTNWAQPTDLRLVLAERPSDWVRSVRRNLVPGAQRGLFDQALRHPARLSALVGPDPRPARPTNAFQLLRLLDHLDVNPTIDLIGFGPGDPFDGAEQDWLGPRGHRVDDQLVSLR
jgi:hypothetical protein